MPDYSYNRTITQIPITGSAGAIDLVAAQAGQRIYVVTWVVILTDAGSFKFTEGTGPTDLTGAMEVGADTLCGVNGNGYPVLATNTVGVKLGITTATGNPRGYLRYFVAP